MSDNRNVVEVPETEDLRGEKIGQEKKAKHRNPFIGWIVDHKRELITSGISLAVGAVGGYLGHDLIGGDSKPELPPIKADITVE